MVKIFKMDNENTHGRMAISMKEIILMINEQENENLHIRINHNENFQKNENLKTINS
jgi:hypothetical protein